MWKNARKYVLHGDRSVLGDVDWVGPDVCWHPHHRDRDCRFSVAIVCCCFVTALARTFRSDDIVLLDFVQEIVQLLGDRLPDGKHHAHAASGLLLQAEVQLLFRDHFNVVSGHGPAVEVGIAPQSPQLRADEERTLFVHVAAVELEATVIIQGTRSRKHAASVVFVGGFLVVKSFFVNAPSDDFLLEEEGLPQHVPRVFVRERASAIEQEPLASACCILDVGTNVRSLREDERAHCDY